MNEAPVATSGVPETAYGLELVRINTDWCKLWVHERINWPQDQPGAFFLPLDATDAYCLQLVSEARMRTKAGRPTWFQKSRENHFLDCEAMAYAAGYMLNVQRIPETRKTAEADEPIVPEREPVPLKPDKPKKPPPPQRTVVRSNFLTRR